MKKKDKKHLIITAGQRGNTYTTTALTMIAEYHIARGMETRTQLYDGEVHASGTGTLRANFRHLQCPPIALDPRKDDGTDLDIPGRAIVTGECDYALVDLAPGDSLYLIPWLNAFSELLTEENVMIYVLISVAPGLRSKRETLMLCESIPSQVSTLLVYHIHPYKYNDESEAYGKELMDAQKHLCLIQMPYRSQRITDILDELATTITEVARAIEAHAPPPALADDQLMKNRMRIAHQREMKQCQSIFEPLFGF